MSEICLYHNECLYKHIRYVFFWKQLIRPIKQSFLFLKQICLYNHDILYKHVQDASVLPKYRKIYISDLIAKVCRRKKRDSRYSFTTFDIAKIMKSGMYVVVNLWKPRMLTFADFFSQCQHTLVHSEYVNNA